MTANRPEALQIDVETFDRLRRQGRDVHLLDDREPWERELCAIEPSISMPLASLTTQRDLLPKDGILVVVCHHGVRSLRAVMWLRHEGFPAVVNLKGGIDAWADRIDRTMVRY